MFNVVGFSRVLHSRTVSMAAMAGRGRNFSTETALRAPIERVSVIGSGLMGSGIAQVIKFNILNVHRQRQDRRDVSSINAHAELHGHHAPSSLKLVISNIALRCF